MVDKIEKDANSDPSTENKDAKPESSTGVNEFGEPIETDAQPDPSTAIEEEPEDEEAEPKAPPLENQVGELRRKLEEAEARANQNYALLEETLKRQPSTQTAPVQEVDIYGKKLEELGIDPDVTQTLRELNREMVAREIQAFKAEMQPLQEGLIGSSERTAVERVLEQKKSDVLNSKSKEIYDLINSYDPSFRARKGAAWVAQKAVASVAGEYVDDIVEERIKAARKKGKSSKRIISESLSDASMMSVEPVEGLTPQEKAYIKSQRAQGSSITEDGYLAAKQRRAKDNARALGGGV